MEKRAQPPPELDFSSSVRVLCTPEQKAQWIKAATSEKKMLSPWVREILDQAVTLKEEKDC